MSPRLFVAAFGGAVLLLALCLPRAAQAQMDAAAAESLAKKSKCMTCHSVDKKKDGPAFKETAAKYRDKPDGSAKLFAHLTSTPKIKVDGKEELHEMPKTKNEAELKNLAAWILSLK